MTKSNHKSRREGEEARIVKALERAEEIMGLEGCYDVRLVFDWGHDGDGAVNEDGGVTVHTTCAVTTAQWAYRLVRMRWFPQMSSDLSDLKLLATAVHEMVHVLLAPIDQFVKDKDGDLNEYATENVMRAVLAAAGIPYPGDDEAFSL